MNMKTFFVLLVLFLLIGCTEKGATEETKTQNDLEEAGEESNTGIEGVFGDGENINPPELPSP